MTSTNPLLEGIKLPGRIFQLPSRGLYYKNGELDETVKEGEIHVQAMSALDEINMKNPDQLYSGEAVRTVFSKCVKGITKPTELLSKDVDAIFLFLRTVTYGPWYEFEATHDCETAKPHSYMISVDDMINRMNMIDPTTIEQARTLTLESGQIVKLRPSLYSEVVDLVKQIKTNEAMSIKDQENILLTILLSNIESVNDIKDKAQISEWLSAISTMTTSEIVKKSEIINSWGTDQKAKIICKDCEKEIEADVPLNPIFFFSASSPKEI